jgi:hypothetical protein
VAGVLASFLVAVASSTRHSIAHKIPHGTRLTVELPSNSDEVSALFLALLNRGECELTLVILSSLLNKAVFEDRALPRDMLRYFVRLAILNEPLKESGYESQQEDEQIYRRQNLLPLACEFHRRWNRPRGAERAWRSNFFFMALESR